MYAAFKFQIIAVLVDVDENGKVKGEVETTAQLVYGLDGIAEYVKSFEGELEKLNEGDRA